MMQSGENEPHMPPRWTAGLGQEQGQEGAGRGGSLEIQLGLGLGNLGLGSLEIRVLFIR